LNHTRAYNTYSPQENQIKRKDEEIFVFDLLLVFAADFFTDSGSSSIPAANEQRQRQQQQQQQRQRQQQ
jgi:hypothetical protein